MQRKYSKLLCCIIVILMTFTGICLDTKQAGVLFEQSNSTLGDHSNLSIISNGKCAITSETICTQKMLGISRITFSRNSIIRKTLRSKQGNQKALMNFDLITVGLKYLHMAKQHMVCISCVYFRTTILNYIHNQDGKK